MLSTATMSLTRCVRRFVPSCRSALLVLLLVVQLLLLLFAMAMLLMFASALDFSLPLLLLQPQLRWLLLLLLPVVGLWKFPFCV